MIGEYVRTKNGEIHKIENDWQLDLIENFWREITGGVVEHSKKLIGIVRVGDYVNGFRVDEIHDFPNGTSRVICNKYVGERQSFNDIQVRSVVTKEQFEEMEYRV